MQLYTDREGWFLFSISPEHGRCHFISGRPATQELTPFVSELRKRLGNARLIRAKQRHWDRLLDLSFETPEGEVTFTAEIMGKHSNLILRTDRVLAAHHWVGPKQSRRPVLAGQPYAEPFEPAPPLSRVSPFLGALLEQPETRKQIEKREFGAFSRPDGAAYPLPFSGATLTYPTFSQALEAGASRLEQSQELDRAKQSLRNQLERVVEARDFALADLQQASDTAARAAKIQREAELILAYQHAAQPGATALEAWDYEGNPVILKLLPHLTAQENAQRLFDKARKAKNGADGVQEQIVRLTADRLLLHESLEKLGQATSLDEVLEVRAGALAKKWLFEHVISTNKEDRPWEGHSIRELKSPAGWAVLYGENATSNDYLTQKVAKPNDWWLHVRGGTSAHVVIRTSNQPDKVQKTDLVWAAQVCARHSPLKHSTMVPVDYTLKKYVRKPRGSAVGLAVYEREKTLHVDP